MDQIFHKKNTHNIFNTTRCAPLPFYTTQNSPIHSLKFYKVTKFTNKSYFLIGHFCDKNAFFLLVS